MPSVTERNPDRNGTYYTDDEVAGLLTILRNRRGPVMEPEAAAMP